MNGRDIRPARRLKPWYISTLAFYRIRISLSHSSRRIFLEEGGGEVDVRGRPRVFMNLNTSRVVFKGGNDIPKVT